MKKLACILLAALFLTALFSGCSGGTPAATTAATTAASEPSGADFNYSGTSPVVTTPVTLTMICGAGGNNVNYDDFAAMKWCNAIVEKSGVTLDIDVIDSSSYNDNIMPRLAAGQDLPDIIQVPGRDTDMTYAKSGIFYDLTSFYDTLAVNLKWRFETNPTVRGQITCPDGKIYYLPGINMSRDYCPALLYNHFWLDKIGAEPPATTADFRAVLEKMKGVDFNGNGEDDEVPLYTETGYLKYFGSSWGLDLAGGYYVNDDGAVEASYISDRYLDYLTFFKGLYDDGLMLQSFASTTGDINNQQATNDQFGFIMHYLNFAHTFSDKYFSGKGEEWDTSYGELAWVPLEAPLKGPFGHQEYIGNDPVFGFWAISAKSEHPEIAFAFCDYLYSEEANNYLYYGIYEDGDYEIRDGKIYPDLAKRTKDDYATKMGNNFGGFPRILLAAHRDVSYNYTIGSYNAKLRDYYRVPVSTFALPEEAETVSSYATDLSTAWNEAFVGFITGTKPLSDFESYVETLKSMHIEDMVAVRQAMYDRVNG